MSSGTEVAQTFHKMLSDAAVEIKKLEQKRDNPNGSGAGMRFAPNGNKAPTQNGNNNSQAWKDEQNDKIANVKAQTMQKTKEMGSQLPAEQQKQMQDKALGAMYPQGKKDLNQLQQQPGVNGKPKEDKNINNAQERMNAQRAGQVSREKQNKQPQSRFAQNLNPKQQAQKDQLSTKTQGTKDASTKTEHSKPKSSMSSRFSQTLNGNNVQKSDIDKKPAGSMSSRFSQSLSPSSPSGSGTGGRSAPSSPGGKGSGGGKDSK